MSPRPSRQEWLILAVIVLAGAALRLAFPGRMAVEHFDEGVYASNIWFGEEQGYRYPAQHLYAPPLLPSLIEWTFIAQSLFGFAPSDFGAMLPSLVAGILMIPLVWWVGREWFGPAAGIASATLCSLSDFHALYSRAALTDVLLAFWLLLAVYLIWRAYLSMRLSTILAAGFVTGLAWWTKYNGWLPLAIGLAGVVPWLIFTSSPTPNEHEPRRAARRQPAVAATGSRAVRGGALPFGSRLNGSRLNGSRLNGVWCWVGIAVVALVVWSPVWFGLQDHGGYSAVAANHRQYVVGFGGWFDSAVRQLANLDYLTSWPTCVGVAVASLLAAVMIVPLRELSRARQFGVVGASGFGGLLLGGAMAHNHGIDLAIVTVVGIGMAWRGGAIPFGSRLNDGAMMDHERQSESLALWMLTAWFCGMLVATPFYRPYPRLMFPWIVACWLGAGLWMQACFEWLIPEGPALGLGPVRRLVSSPVFLAMVPIFLLLLLGLRVSDAPTTDLPPEWQSRTGLERIAVNITEETARIARDNGTPPDEVIVYVYGEPAEFFQLRKAGLELVGPVRDLAFAAEPPRRPTFLVVGPHAEESAAFAAQWAERQGSFRRVVSWDYQPSDLVVLDGDVLPQRGERLVETVALYQLAK